MKWEYKCATFNFTNDSELQAKLNALGGHGWELVKINTMWDANEYSSDCIFKREKPKSTVFTKDGLAYAVLRHAEEEEA